MLLIQNISCYIRDAKRQSVVLSQQPPLNISAPLSGTELLQQVQALDESNNGIGQSSTDEKMADESKRYTRMSSGHSLYTLIIWEAKKLC